jgi:acetolactate synthase-1/2/3 large subunit
MNGGALVVRALEEAGVEVVFGLPGVHNLAIWRALAESPIRLVGVRHEQAAAYAADGYARTSGKPGVALVTTGPGAANAVGATGEAWACGSPIVVIATDIPASIAAFCTRRPTRPRCSARSRRRSCASPTSL